MSETSSTRSSIGSLVASRRRRLAAAPAEDTPRLPVEQGMRLHLARSGETLIEGHIADPAEPDRRFVVELLLDGLPSGLARADLFVPTLASGSDALGDACYGFVFAIDAATLPFVSLATVRIANDDRSLGPAIRLHEAQAFEPPATPGGSVAWLGGLDFEGWTRREPTDPSARIEARIDDVVVAQARADRWREVRRGGEIRAERGFRLRLPEVWADGRAHEVEFLADGRPLPGGPLPFLAVADGIAAMLEDDDRTQGERPRGEHFDRWFPNGVPFADFERWEDRFPPSVPELPAGTLLALAVIGEEGAEASLAASALEALDDWIGVVLPERGDGGFDPRDLRQFLEGEGAACTIVLLLRAGTIARAGGAERLAAALLAEPSAAVAYGDLLLRAHDGTTSPLLLTAFDHERALEQGCAGTPLAMRRDALLAALEAGADDLDRLFLAPLNEGFSSADLHWHVPGFGFAVPIGALGTAQRLAEGVRAHLARRGTPAEVEARPPATLPAVRVRREPRGRVTILLDAGPCDDAAIAACLEALEATRARSPADILVSAPEIDPAAERRLRLDGYAVVSAPRGTSPARRLGEAAGRIQGELLCLLDARLRPLDDGWLQELMGRMADPGTALAAPVLVDRFGAVVEAGLLLELGRAPHARLLGGGLDDPGFGDMLLVAHRASCVGPGALLTRRTDFLALGGFDPVLFPRHLGAADYALKLQALGHRVVVAPDARLLREAPPLRRSEQDDPALAREVATLSARWAATIAADPFGHPFLRRGPPAFSGLAWPPAAALPRTPVVPAPRAGPPGWS